MRKKDKDIWMAFKIIGVWLWRKIDLTDRIAHGFKILIAIGVAGLLLNIAITNTDKFWRWALGLGSAESVVFTGFGLLAMILLAYTITIITDIFRYWVDFLNNHLPKAIREHQILKNITGNSFTLTTWRFFVRDKQSRKDKEKSRLQKLTKSQPAIISPYSPWGMEELGFIIGQTNFGKEKAKRWRVAIPSPPIIFSGGKTGFIKDHNIVFLIKIPLPELINFYASYGIVSREHFETLDKKLYDVEIDIKPEDLPKVKEICDLESLRRLYGIEQTEN